VIALRSEASPICGVPGPPALPSGFPAGRRRDACPTLSVSIRTGNAAKETNGLWEIAGGREDPAIVFEHPGAATIPTSVFLRGPGGMVVICAGTTGFDAMVDLRYHWTRQKRPQGSHGTNDEQAIAYNQWSSTVSSIRLSAALCRSPNWGRRTPAWGGARTFFGNISILIGAQEPGLGRQ
jgi:crotonyl-CoA carboxylase/reductase